jgi:hypothetical protein
MRNYEADSRKHRKSSHLASDDIHIMKSEGRELTFTIKAAYYSDAEMVNGTKMEGYFVEFKEPIKDMKVNSGNRKIIALFANNKGFTGNDSFNVKNWVGLRITLYVNPNTKFMGALVDGIKVDKLQPVDKPKTLPPFTKEQFKKAKTAGATIEAIKKSYTITKELETEYLKLK